MYNVGSGTEWYVTNNLSLSLSVFIKLILFVSSYKPFNHYYCDSICVFDSHSDLNPSKGSVRTSVHAIRVVTLDLDNTLWKTSATIDAANDALAEFLSMKLEQTKMIRVEHVMGKLYQANEKRYAPLQINNLVKGPVLLTLLRKDAIRYTLTNHNESGLVDNDQSIENIVEEAFLVWRDARHQSIPLHFAKAVVECLQEIRSLPTKDNATKIIVGAVTDGNSDPFAIQDISTYFDFCINAESIGIGKPDKRIYLQAVAQALQHPTSSLQDLIPTSLALTSMDQFSEQQLEDLIGPWWVHIGDDFVKDCVAAKNLNMRTIWTRELVQDKIIKEDTWKRAAESSKSKRNDIQSFVHKVSNSAVVEMAVGADDYLANSLKEEFADAVLDEFRCVAMVLRQWQEEALTSSSSFVTQTKDSTKDDPPEFLESIDQTTNLEKLEGAIHFDVEDSKSSTTTETKFCIFCGTKLPVIAKFCFSCGKEQQ